MVHRNMNNSNLKFKVKEQQDHYTLYKIQTGIHVNIIGYHMKKNKNRKEYVKNLEDVKIT